MTILAGLTTRSRPQRTFFDALAAADRHLDEVDHLRNEASWAPQVQMAAHCSCGRVFEIRSHRLELDADELAEAVSVAGDAELVERIVHAINRARANADYEAEQQFLDAHASCPDTWGDDT